MKVKFEGGKRLEAALASLPRATAKNVARRTLKKAAEPIDNAASAAAPVDEGDLQLSVIAGTRLTRRQRTRTPRGESKNYVEYHVGTSMPRGMWAEFGTYKQSAVPWFRPVWDRLARPTLRFIQNELAGEVEKSVARYRKKLAKKGR